jgi:hypothetical protein
MIHPFEQYKKLQNLDNVTSIAYQILFENYILNDVRGKDKLIYMESTDNESLINTITSGYPLPGLIYTFIYKPEKGDEIKLIDGTNIKEYIDYVPLIFCVTTSLDKTTFSGINLNTLPPQERLKFLIAYYEAYKTYMSDVERSTENNIISWNKDFIELSKSGKAQDLIKSFNSRMSANFNYGYRKYKMSRVDGIRMIEYNEWQYIAWFNGKDSFRKMNQKQINDFYYKVKAIK